MTASGASYRTWHGGVTLSESTSSGGAAIALLKARNGGQERRQGAGMEGLRTEAFMRLCSVRGARGLLGRRHAKSLFPARHLGIPQLTVRSALGVDAKRLQRDDSHPPRDSGTTMESQKPHGLLVTPGEQKLDSVGFQVGGRRNSTSWAVAPDEYRLDTRPQWGRVSATKLLQQSASTVLRGRRFAQWPSPKVRTAIIGASGDPHARRQSQDHTSR